MRDGMAVATPWDLPLRLIRAFMLVITLIFGISWRPLLMVLMALIANRLPTLLLKRRLAIGDWHSMMHKIRQCACGQC